MCLVQGPQKSANEKKRQGHDKYSVLKGCELAQTLGTGTMHGGMAAPRSLLTETEAAWPDQRLSGATEEDGRESRSEAEGKIETDFLAGVEIMDGQMI